MKLNTVDIGQRIKNRRKELNLTQTDIKAAVGISSGNISDIENGNRLPAAATLAQLASVLQCSIDWILTGKSPVKENFISPSPFDRKTASVISSFQKLNQDDQEEIVEIIEMKLRRSRQKSQTADASETPHLQN